MALMIPPALTHDARAPKGEREVLTTLGSDSGTSDAGWVVMHSLSLRLHVNKLEGEADFLVLAPGLGILVVEVKGCKVSRTNGRWTYHYQPEKRESSEGPFKQAKSAMHSLKKWLGRQPSFSDRGLGNWDRWVWHSCVVFTEIDFGLQAGMNHDGPEWVQSEVIPTSQISRDGIARCLENSLAMRHLELAARKREEIAARNAGATSGSGEKPSTSALWYDSTHSRPTTNEVQALANVLRPDFCFNEDGIAWIRRLETAIAGATKGQAEVALSLLDNKRLVIKGAAGTGKTYVAIRMAKYFAQEGLRVGFFCFNNLLAKWLEGELGGDLEDRGYVGTLAAFMVSTTREDPAGKSPDFWATELPAIAVDQLSTQKDPSRFDVLFVDEAQDLLKEHLLDVLDLLVVGGLADGQWVFAGDFSGQAIYDSQANEEELLQRLSVRKLQHSFYSLKRNCRNARAVHGAIRSLGFGRDYESCLDHSSIGEMKPHFVNGDAARTTKLLRLLAELQKRFSPEDIVVLSYLAENSSAAALARDPASKLCKLNGPSPPNGNFGYATIHAFKGLDARVIIVTDLPSLEGEHEKLLYTGISRGRLEVHLILDERLQASWVRRVQA